MSPDNRRPDRVAEAIREEVANFLAEGVKDPRVSGFVTVTGVDITRDLRHAKVYVSVMGTDEEKSQTFEGLAGVAVHLRGRIGRALRLRLAPEIAFKPDESIARASRIESLLGQLKTESIEKEALHAERDAAGTDDVDGSAPAGPDDGQR